ncbi:MAG: hypothetical protein HY902_09795 [Deltaproteobacteria bacterium]|nr:hypothetical protein [Deltaproteobacteria bacterium]
MARAHLSAALRPFLVILPLALAAWQCSDPSGAATGDAHAGGSPFADVKFYFDAAVAADATAPDSSAIADGDAGATSPADAALADTQPIDASQDADAADVPCAPKPEACNGVDDDCDGKTDDGACDDGNGCTVDTCKGASGTCAHAAKTGVCDDGNPCSQNDQCNGTACVAGDPASCDDDNPCTTDSCEPATGCKSLPAAATPCTDDGDTCTADVCDAGVCSHPIAPGMCKIAGACVAAGAVSLQNPCLFCDPAVTPLQYAPKDGAACDDGNPCTVSETCQGAQCKGPQKDCTSLDGTCAVGACNPASGACAPTPKAGGTACDDGNPCTTQDKCDGSGVCTAQPLSCTALDDACHSGVCSGGQCLKQAKPSGTACSDGDACTQGDTCTAGTCSGAPMDCSAKADACHTGVCTAGKCGALAKPNGAGCDDKSPCTSNDICSSGVCAGTLEQDSFEANNSSASPATLAAKSDCDNESSLSAMLSPAGDSDWYTYEVTDDTFCTIKPSATLDNLGGDYELCIYFICKGKSAASDQVSCSNGSKTAGVGPNGAFGCCSSNPGIAPEFAKLDPLCSFLATGSESGTVWVQVTSKPGAACGGYKMTWTAQDPP